MELNRTSEIIEKCGELLSKHVNKKCMLSVRIRIELLFYCKHSIKKTKDQLIEFLKEKKTKYCITFKLWLKRKF